MKILNYCAISIGIFALTSFGIAQADPVSNAQEDNINSIFKTIDTMNMPGRHPISYVFHVDTERYFVDSNEAIFSEDMILATRANTLSSCNTITPPKSEPSSKAKGPSMPLLILVGLIGIGSIPRKWSC